MPGVRAGVLDREPRLVGELAEVHLGAVRRAAQHDDVRAGAEDALLERGDDDGAHLGVLEAQALDGVGELDVDAEVVGVELQLVVVGQAGVLAHVHRQRGDRAVEGQLPVLVGVGVGFEGDQDGSVLKLNARSNYFRAVTTGESTVPSRPQSLKRPRRRGERPRNADPNASTRVDILKSAAKAFRRLGYHGATVEQIAAALHMKKGNLYYYFKNKEEILFACHQYSLDRLLAAARRGRAERPRAPTRSCGGSSSRSCTRFSTSCTARRCSSSSRRSRPRT